MGENLVGPLANNALDKDFLGNGFNFVEPIHEFIGQHAKGINITFFVRLAAPEWVGQQSFERLIDIMGLHAAG